MFKDIGYILRGPLAIACLLCSVWYANKLQLDISLMLLLCTLFIPFVGLVGTYSLQKVLNKIWRPKSWVYLPPENKYAAVTLFCMVTTIPSPKSVWAFLFVIPAFQIYVELGGAVITGGLLNFFEDTIRFKEFALSLTLVSWILTAATVTWYGFTIGAVVGLATPLVLMFLLLLGILLTQMSYRLIGHEFFRVDHAGKIHLNRKEDAEPEDSTLRNAIEADNPGMNNQLAKSTLNLAEQLFVVQKQINQYDFDNNRSGLVSALASYQRWKDESQVFLEVQISGDEAEKFKALETSQRTEGDAASINKEIDRLLPYLHSLAEALRKGKVEIMSKPIQHKRYRVLHKLHELSLSEGATTPVPIDILVRDLDLPIEDVTEVLSYWEKKELVQTTSSSVKLTPFGFDEIEKTINSPEQPTTNFPAHIVNNFNISVGTNYGAIQQGGQHNTIKSTVSITTDVDEAAQKLIELIKGSQLGELDKEEIVDHVNRVQDLAKKEKTPEVAERAKSRLELIRSTLDLAKDAGGLAVRAAPYLATIARFFFV